MSKAVIVIRVTGWCNSTGCWGSTRILRLKLIVTPVYQDGATCILSLKLIVTLVSQDGATGQPTVGRPASGGADHGGTKCQPGILRAAGGKPPGHRRQLRVPLSPAASVPAAAERRLPPSATDRSLLDCTGKKKKKRITSVPANSRLIR